VLRGKSSGYQIRDTMNVRRGLAKIAHDQAEHLTTLAILVQNGLERRRISFLIKGMTMRSRCLELLQLFHLDSSYQDPDIYGLGDGQVYLFIGRPPIL
jgi:hypothetical protein